MNTYLFRVKYFDEYAEPEGTIEDAYGTVYGNKYSEAIQHIEARFSNIDDIYIREMFLCDGFTFLEKDTWMELLREEILESACDEDSVKEGIAYDTNTISNLSEME